MIDLSIIIVSYNTKELLKECIQSIEGTLQGHSFEIIVVDNGSSDGSVEEIKKLKSSLPVRLGQHIKLIENNENTGFSRANNIGINKAQGRYLLFLNSDTVVYKNTIDLMVEFMDHNEDVGAATCRVELLSGKLDDACHRGFPTPWNSLNHFSGVSKIFSKSKIFAGYSLGFMDLSKAHEIDACAGAFMMVRRKAGEDVAWWDEDYFWYGEDLDFCYRLKQNGWKIYFVPQVRILHYKGASGGLKSSSAHLTKADETTKKLATKARFDAMRIFYNKNYRDTYPGIVSWMVNRGIDLRSRL